MRKKIYVDLDCTLCCLMTPVLDQINDKYNLDIKLSDVKHYSWLKENISRDVNQIWDTPSIYDYAYPFDGSFEFMNKLKDKYEVFIISTCSDSVIKRKEKYVEDVFGIDSKHFICADKKFEWTWNGILIDDYILHINSHVNINKNMGILFNYNHQHPWAKLDPCLPKNKLIFECNNYSSLSRIIEMNY